VARPDLLPFLRRALSGPLLLVALLVAGCASPEPAADPAAQQSTAAPTASSDAHGGHGGHGGHGSAGVPAPTLYAVQTAPLGVVLTDGAGHLLYRSDADTAEPPTSTCSGACAETWLPVVVEPGEELDLAGVDADLVGQVQRADGTTQLTLAGWPLYRHRDDDGSLASTGQNGADGTWFVVTPKGEKATPA
jgi:predicted lipoprotein with Yx(FWY)xxD motif